MLFNSFEFLLAFLPLTLGLYFLLGTLRTPVPANRWLLAASMFFYGWVAPTLLLLLMLSIGVNFALAQGLQRAGEGTAPKWRRGLLILGLAFNVGLLCYFKYTNFLIDNVNVVLRTHVRHLDLVLPIGISFFSLQQVGFLVDVFQGIVKQRSFLDYALFVSFFPHVTSGPIVTHAEMARQYDDATNKRPNLANIREGLLLFAIGLVKKVVLADTLAGWVAQGFAQSDQLNIVGAWVTALSFSLQVYFDFSGYTDMALGVAQLFNIVLPANFRSPFRARNVIDFWSRWHITLTRFLTTYLYTPIVRSFSAPTLKVAFFATVVTMLVSGLWHGATWLFIAFGALHGIALCVNHLLRTRKIKLPRWLAWLLTFQFVNVTFVLFRAGNLAVAGNVLSAMYGLKHGAWALSRTTADGWTVTHLQQLLSAAVSNAHLPPMAPVIVVGAVAFCLIAKTSREMAGIVRRAMPVRVAFYLVLLYSLVFFGVFERSTYVYFKF